MTIAADVSRDSDFESPGWAQQSIDESERTRRLVAACRNDCPMAWRALIEQYSPLVWAITHSFRLSKHDCEDVFQSSWANIVAHLTDLQSPERLRAWLATTVRRECLKHLQRGTRHVLVEDDAALEVVGADSDATAHQVFRRVAGHQVRVAFQQLPERDQRLLGLLMSDSAPDYTTVSGQLGLPRGSIGPLRSRALNRLRGLLPPAAEGWMT
ncbi:RNA polymerase sigma factor [Nocardia sp. NPDC020380]|uniref:RNA polymerase sigma factor n=1 Tax=Nocardia sp. NPDC020380 TaxID=3364309 RepID=UPI0037A77927